MTNASEKPSIEPTVTASTNLTGLLYVLAPKGTWGLVFKDGKLVDRPPQARQIFRLGLTLGEATRICIQMHFSLRWFRSA